MLYRSLQVQIFSEDLFERKGGPYIIQNSNCLLHLSWRLRLKFIQQRTAFLPKGQSLLFPSRETFNSTVCEALVLLFPMFHGTKEVAGWNK